MNWIPGILFLLGLVVTYQIGRQLTRRVEKGPLHYRWGEWCGMLWLLLGGISLMLGISAPWLPSDNGTAWSAHQLSFFLIYAAGIPGFLTLRRYRLGGVTGTLLAWYLFPLNLLLFPINWLYFRKRWSELHGQRVFSLSLPYLLPGLVCTALHCPAGPAEVHLNKRPAFEVRLPPGWKEVPTHPFAFNKLYTHTDRAWLGVITEAKALLPAEAYRRVTENLQKVSQGPPQFERRPPESINGLEWQVLHARLRMEGYDLTYVCFVHTQRTGHDPTHGLDPFVRIRSL